MINNKFNRHKRFSKKKRNMKSKKKTFLHSSQDEYSFADLLSDVGNQEIANFFESGLIQAKLNVSQSGDIYEREADKIANDIVNSNTIGTPKVKRVQGKSGAKNISVSNNSEYKIKSLKGKGNPLNESIREYFEPRFGIDLGNVRVHTDSNANQLANYINAKAFTYGSDIVFGKNEYNPGSTDGRKLIAHELAHTIQQDREMIYREDGDTDFLIQEVVVGDHENEIWLVIRFTTDNNITESLIQKNINDTGIYFEISSIEMASDFKIGKNFELNDNKDWEYVIPLDWKSVATKIRVSEAIDPFTITFDAFSTDNINYILGHDNEGRSVIIFKIPDMPQNAQQFQVAGDITSNNIIRVAWTFDDGPGYFTEDIEKLFSTSSSDKSPTPVGTTYFISYNNIVDSTGTIIQDEIDALLTLQNIGAEIGIHNFSRLEDHLCWFPAKEKDAYSSIVDAMTDLKVFKTVLNNEGINPNFVRPPYGLVTELIYYAWLRGFRGSDGSAVGYGIIADDTFDALNTSTSNTNSDRHFTDTLPENARNSFNEIREAYQKMCNTLNELDLLLWGGTEDPNKITFQDWEAETSGVTSRHDTTTRSVTHLERRGGNDYVNRYAGRFEDLVDQIKNSNGASCSMIVLAHVTTQADINAIEQDKNTMEVYCINNKVRIEYHTLSSLFKHVTGNEIIPFKANY